MDEGSWDLGLFFVRVAHWWASALILGALLAARCFVVVLLSSLHVLVALPILVSCCILRSCCWEFMGAIGWDEGMAAKPRVGVRAESVFGAG